MSTASHHDQPANGSPQPPPTTGGHILSAALAIALIYLASAAALWFLSMIGPISATVNGVIEKSGGSIWFAAGGVVAAFAIILVFGPDRPLFHRQNNVPCRPTRGEAHHRLNNIIGTICSPFVRLR